MQIVTVEQMRRIEQVANSQGLPYATMMEAAGRAVAAWVESEGARGRQVLVLVGPGNNGGDGLVAARYLHQAGARVAVYCWKRDVAADPNWDAVQDASIPCIWREQDEGCSELQHLASESDWVLDALLGTGVSKPIAGTLQDILSAVAHVVAARRAPAQADALLRVVPALVEPQAMPRPRIVAVDVPSGLNSDTGSVDPATLPADVTVTLGFPKVGQFLFPGAALVGELIVADIGIPARLASDVSLELSTADRIRALLPKRPSDAHKGTFGRAMVVAGSSNYTGAPYLAASAAMRVGAGLVTLAVPELLHPILAARLSEATYLLLPHQMGALVPDAVKVLLEGLSGYDALLLGPGLGRDEQTVEFVARLLSLPASERRARLGFVAPATTGEESRSQLPPLVIDADGLNALADRKGWPQSLPRSTILTPHAGEMARLLGTTVANVNASRIELARRAAQEWQAVVVLKGAYTVIASPQGQACINPFATSALATAGSGDVLAGAIVGLLAQGLAPYDAAVAGAYLHGLAGQMVAAELGAAGGIAGDLLCKLPLGMRKLTAQ